MSLTENHLPLVHPLPSDFSLVDAFESLKRRPGLIWLDSAARGPDGLGRYSFLSSDPIDSIVASIGDPDPWLELARWCHKLPGNVAPGLPPFQGGIAGVIGYEAASWLEPIPVAGSDATSLPVVGLGFYDWTLATDHESGRSWLVCQGAGQGTMPKRLQSAEQRRDEVLDWLATPVSPPAPSSIAVAKPTANQPTAQQSPEFATIFEGVTSNFAPGEFASRVRDVVERIRAGDSFQVNLAQRLSCPAPCDPATLYLALRAANPAPFGGYFATKDFAVLSSSPEGFLTVRDRVVETRPIKGTVPRTGDAVRDETLASQLAASQKDRAENIMIVDLMRNDLSRVCEDESVVVRKLCQVERYQFVQHLVSVIEGRLKPAASLCDLLRACFPGGSVTGAPKIEAMTTIAQLEPHPRGPYCGSMGYISSSGTADFNILIRTMVVAAGQCHFPVGGGITARSDAASEEAETWTKARGMLAAIEAARASATSNRQSSSKLVRG